MRTSRLLALLVLAMPCFAGKASPFSIMNNTGKEVRLTVLNPFMPYDNKAFLNHNDTDGYLELLAWEPSKIAPALVNSKQMAIETQGKKTWEVFLPSGKPVSGKLVTDVDDTFNQTFLLSGQAELSPVILQLTGKTGKFSVKVLGKDPTAYRVTFKSDKPGSILTIEKP